LAKKDGRKAQISSVGRKLLYENHPWLKLILFFSLQHLLKHPVIAAFLFMKWQRMGPAYNKNLLFYLARLSIKV
jgi:hypothetical protein